MSFSWYSLSLSRDRRHEVFAAAATAAAEAAEVGEQRRRIHGRHPQPNVAVRHAGATQGFVDVVVDARTRLPFAIHRHVRLDARVPTRVNVAPGRLLRLAPDEYEPHSEAQEKERESDKGSARGKESRYLRENLVYLNNLRLNN